MEEAGAAATFLGLIMPTWGSVIVLIGIIGGVVTWKLDQCEARKLRKEELVWRRAEFLFKQGEIFDGDNDISVAVKVITGNDSNLTVLDLFDPKSGKSDEVRGAGMHKLDKLLNLLERIASANIEGVLSIGDVRCFEWYFDRISRIPVLIEYCEHYYPGVLAAADRMKPNA